MTHQPFKPLFKDLLTIKKSKKMTEEQLLKGRDLRDAILEAKENVKHLTSDFTDRNPAVKLINAANQSQAALIQ